MILNWSETIIKCSVQFSFRCQIVNGSVLVSYDRPKTVELELQAILLTCVLKLVRNLFSSCLVEIKLVIVSEPTWLDSTWLDL